MDKANKSLFITIFLIFLLMYFIQSKIVVLPFNELESSESKEYQVDSKFSSFINEHYRLQLYTTIKLGTPSQLMMGIFNSKTNQFIVGDDKICYEKPEYNYFPSVSKTSKNITRIQGYDYYDGYSLINETISIFTDKNLKRLEEVPDFQFYYKDENINDFSKIFCADFGFQVSYQKDYWAKFVKHIKNKGFINSDLLSMEYSKDKGGFFYLGGFPHEYDSKNFSEKQLIQTYSIPKASFQQFRIIMDNVTFYDENKPLNLKINEVFFYVDLGVIMGSREYLSYIQHFFFEKYNYIENKICSLNTSYLFDEMKSVRSFVCEADESKFNIKKFPSLYFYHKELNFTFNLDYKDLFTKVDDKYYFLIVFENIGLDNWKLGKPFLKKYQLTLNLDTKIVYFYNRNIRVTTDDDENKTFDKKEKIKNIILIVICAALSFTLFGLIIFFNEKLKEHRKIRANELKDEEYEYDPINEN